MRHNAKLKMTINNIDWSRSGAVFNYYSLYIDDVLPVSGSIDGGTGVVIWGYKFEDRPELSCKFNNVSVQAYKIDEDELQCTPLHLVHYFQILIIQHQIHYQLMYP